MLGALAHISPLAAAGVTCTIATGTAVVALNPTIVMAVAAFLTTATPKAGVTVGAFPIPFVMLLLFVVVPILRGRAKPSPTSAGRLAAMALAWLGACLVGMVFNGGSLGDMAALVGWYGLPIVLLLAGPAVGSLQGEEGRRWVAALEFGMLAACSFALVQQVFGIDRTTIPGLTLSAGADYSLKPLRFVGGTKIPSTYQNGNVFGVATGFFFLIAAHRILGGLSGRRDKVMLLATATATLLSGSRTVVLGLLLGSIILVLRSRVSRRTIGVALGVAGMTLCVLAFSPALADRLFTTTAQDPNVVVRTSSWSRLMAASSLSEIVVGGPTWVGDTPEDRAEGVVGAVQQVGLVGMALAVAAVLAATSRPELRRWRLILIPVAVSLAVDSAYLVFPTLFIPLARMFAPLDHERETAPAPPHGPAARTTSLLS